MQKFDRPRSAFGRWVKDKGISLVDLSKKSDLPISTLSALSTRGAQKPIRRTGDKLIKAIRTIDPEAKESDFWDV